MSALFVLREVERCHGAAPDLRRGASDRRDPWYGREVKGGRPPYDNSVNRGPVDRPAERTRDVPPRDNGRPWSEGLAQRTRSSPLPRFDRRATTSTSRSARCPGSWSRQPVCRPAGRIGTTMAAEEGEGATVTPSAVKVTLRLVPPESPCGGAQTAGPL